MWWLSGNSDYQPDLIETIRNFRGDKYGQVIGKSNEPHRFPPDGDYSRAVSAAKELGLRYIEPWPWEFQHHTHDSVFADFNSWADENFESMYQCTNDDSSSMSSSEVISSSSVEISSSEIISSSSIISISSVGISSSSMEVLSSVELSSSFEASSMDEILSSDEEEPVLSSSSLADVYSSSEILASITELPIIDVLYSNPNLIHIHSGGHEIMNVFVFSLSGEFFLKQNVRSGEDVMLERLPRGIYILSISNEYGKPINTSFINIIQ